MGNCDGVWLVQIPCWHMKSLNWRRRTFGWWCCVSILRLPTTPQCHSVRNTSPDVTDDIIFPDRCWHAGLKPQGRADGGFLLRRRGNGRIVSAQREDVARYRVWEGEAKVYWPQRMRKKKIRAGHLVRIKARCQLRCNFTLLCKRVGSTGNQNLPSERSAEVMPWFCSGQVRGADVKTHIRFHSQFLLFSLRHLLWCSAFWE